MGTGWDQLVAVQLRKEGLNQDQICTVIGILAEHRQRADREGYKRGFESGFEYAMDKVRKDAICKEQNT